MGDPQCLMGKTPVLNGGEHQCLMQVLLFVQFYQNLNGFQSTASVGVQQNLNSLKKNMMQFK